MEYDVVFPSIFVSSITFVFKEDSSSYATPLFRIVWIVLSIQRLVAMTRRYSLLL